MKATILLSLILSTVTVVYAQNEHFPIFAGTQNTFDNYFYEKFRAMRASTEKTCDTSLGIVEFYIDKDGNVSSVFIPPNFPEEVTTIIDFIIRDSKWAPVGKEKTSVAIMLPLYISIETGCKSNDIKRGFGREKDFRMMLPNLKEKPAVNCFLMKPITFYIPSGFSDIDSKN